MVKSRDALFQASRVLDLSGLLVLSCSQALEVSDLHRVAPKLRALDTACSITWGHRHARQLPELEALRSRNHLHDVLPGSLRLHTLVFGRALSPDDVSLLAAQAPGLRRLVCRDLLSSAADALSSLPLEELATGLVHVLTRPLPATLHTLKIANTNADFKSVNHEFFNLPGLRRLTLCTSGSHLRLRDLAVAERLEVLRLRGFTIHCEEPRDANHINIRVQFPVNVRVVSLENCKLVGGGRRLPGLDLTGNSLLESFAYTRVPDAESFPATMLRLAPTILDLSIGPVALTPTTFQHMDLRGSNVRSVALELSSAGQFLPLNPPQAVLSVTCLTLTGEALSIRWAEYLATGFPEIRNCALKLFTFGQLLHFPEFTRLLGRLRGLRARSHGLRSPRAFPSWLGD